MAIAMVMRDAHIGPMRQDDPFAVEITPDLIIRAYRAGIFPMAEDASSSDVFWVSPTERGVIPLDNFHISKSLRKALKRKDHTVRVDSDFERVIEGCATCGSDRDNTWINKTIRDVYGALFDRGVCHTVEVWGDDGELIGGLYGLAIGGAFFGESMFHRRTNASKIALAHLLRRLNAGGFALLDTQFITDHLESLGGIEIPRAEYEAQLAQALPLAADFYALDKQSDIPPSA